MFDLDKFIENYVTKRSQSMFLKDIEKNRDKLSEKINGKKILVIGGAGSIGFSFIKAILPFKPASLIVVMCHIRWTLHLLFLKRCLEAEMDLI